MPKFRVEFELVAKGHYVIEADSEMEATDLVEEMDESQLFNDSCAGFDHIEITGCEEVE